MDTPVGIDAESLRQEAPHELIDTCFTMIERSHLSQLSMRARHDALCGLWKLKGVLAQGGRRWSVAIAERLHVPTQWPVPPDVPRRGIWVRAADISGIGARRQHIYLP